MKHQNISVTGSLNLNGVGVATTSTLNAFTASSDTKVNALIANTGSYATTGSNTFTGSQIIQGTLTAQTLVVQTVTSSVLYTTGSNIIGSSLSNVQQITGSVGITGSLAINGTGAVVGTGTINELSYWVTANSIGALSVATYPSLTELSYVKGVTSSIQTQLNAKASTLSGTTNYIPKFTSSTAIGNSVIFEESNAIRIGGTTSALASNRKLTVYGSAGIEVVASGTGGEPTLEMWQKHTAGNNVFAYFFTEATATTRGYLQYDRSGNRLNLVGSGSGLLFTGAATFSSGISIGGATATTGGIQFPATAVAIADGNNLDDYEEGTWTPVIRGSGTAGTYQLATDYTTYTKIGRQVTVSASIRLGTSVTGGGTGYLQITGLPFQKAANTAAIGSVLLNGVDFTGNYVIIAFASISASSILYLAETVDNNTPNDLPISSVSANDEIVFTITYLN